MLIQIKIRFISCVNVTLWMYDLYDRRGTKVEKQVSLKKLNKYFKINKAK